MFRHCETSRNLTLNPRLSAKNTPLFLFPYMGHSLQIFAKVMPYLLMYSALHIMQWFSHILDVFTLKIRWKFLDVYISWIKTNVAYTRHDVIARTKYCTKTTASNWFVTLYCKLLPAWAHPQNMAVGDLAFYYTLYLWHDDALVQKRCISHRYTREVPDLIYCTV